MPPTSPSTDLPVGRSRVPPLLPGHPLAGGNQLGGPRLTAATLTPLGGNPPPGLTASGIAIPTTHPHGRPTQPLQLGHHTDTNPTPPGVDTQLDTAEEPTIPGIVTRLADLAVPHLDHTLAPWVPDHHLDPTGLHQGLPLDHRLDHRLTSGLNAPSQLRLGKENLMHLPSQCSVMKPSTTPGANPPVLS